MSSHRVNSFKKKIETRYRIHKRKAQYGHRVNSFKKKIETLNAIPLSTVLYIRHRVNSFKKKIETDIKRGIPEINLIVTE